MPNPPVLSLEALQLADNHTILVFGYLFVVASVSLAFSLLFYYWLWRFLGWFLPHYWGKNR